MTGGTTTNFQPVIYVGKSMRCIHDTTAHDLAHKELVLTANEKKRESRTEESMKGLFLVIAMILECVGIANAQCRNEGHMIGGRHLNSGIRGGLWEKKHSDAMGESVYLFGWLILRQTTTQGNGKGLVLRGKPLTYADIMADTGWPERTLHRWMARLQKGGYIEVSYSVYSRMVIRILNAKKFTRKQLDFVTSSSLPTRPEVADPSRPTLADSTRPPVADITTKSGLLKEGAEFEQKDLRSGVAAAATGSDTLNPWKIMGSDLPMGTLNFQAIVEHYFAARNGNSLSEAMERAIQRAIKMGVRVPPPFYDAKRSVERREMEELSSPLAIERPELEELPWAK